MELQHLFLTTFFMPIGVRQSGYEGKVCVLFLFYTKLFNFSHTFTIAQVSSSQ